VYENPWLISKEKYLAQLTQEMLETDNPQRIGAMKGLVQIIRNKLKLFHNDQGS